MGWNVQRNTTAAGRVRVVSLVYRSRHQRTSSNERYSGPHPLNRIKWQCICRFFCKCMAMKKILFCSLLSLMIAGFASAQSTSRNRNSGKTVSSSPYKPVKTDGKKSASATAIPKDNRKEYVKDGQLATSTGHQATPVNSDEYQSPRDSANKKKKKQ
jgi:hypothetical protein